MNVDPMGTADVFEQVASEFDEVIPLFSTYGQMLVDWVDPAPGSRVLDLGAGRGAIAVPAATRGCRVIAVDAAAQMVARLAADHPGLTAQVMNAEHLDLPGGGMDVVTAGFMLRLTARPERVVTEAFRVLRSGGVFAFTMFDLSQVAPAWAECYQTIREYWQSTGAVTDDPFAVLDPPRMLRAAGFTEVVEESVQVRLPLADPDDFWRWMESTANRVVLDALTPERRAQLRAILHQRVAAMEPMVFEHGAQFWLARVP